MFKIKNSNGNFLNYKFFLFPAGEVGVKLDRSYTFFADRPNRNYTITAQLHNSNDVVSLAMIKDAIEREDMDAKIDLVCPYFPYARQDRKCDNGEAFALKVFANFINSLNFNSVTVYDPHSEVTPALINRVKVVTQLDILQVFSQFRDRITFGNAVFVSPDAGSNKKVSNLASFCNHNMFIRADKLRDLSDGRIKETIVYCDDLQRSDVVIVDDICDGGATFIALAEALRKKNCGKVILYVTHGIFSKGIDALLKNGIDEIYCTNSFTANWMGDLPTAPQFNVMEII
jgi:ribose-phosphate pyrophosphokinase